MKLLTTYIKWEIVQDRMFKDGMGELLNPETATKHYDVDFTELRYTKDYKVGFSCSIGADGVRPELNIYFTKKGIKKLLKTNRKMIDEVNKEYEELINE